MKEEPEPRNAHFLVTGASGFVAMHLTQLLLSRGHRVRGTLRRMAREREVREAAIRRGHSGDRLELVAAELGSDGSWDEAMAGIDGVFHVASPVPGSIPLEDASFVGPAVSGTLRVLEAAHRARVKRVVMTSSVAAMTNGHACRSQPFSEQDWSIVESASPYEKSKTLAERAAWQWVAAHPDTLELVSINPSFVLGPTLWMERSPSLDLVQVLLDGRVPGVADLHFGIVDVRDVAEAHYLAMLRPEACGQRFLCNCAVLSYYDIACVLGQYLAPRGVRIRTRRLPNWFVRAVGLFNPSVKFVIPRLGQRKELDNSRLRDLLGWRPRSVEQTLRDTADSLLAGASK